MANDVNPGVALKSLQSFDDAIEAGLLIADNQQINNCERELRFEAFISGGMRGNGDDNNSLFDSSF